MVSKGSVRQLFQLAPDPERVAIVTVDRVWTARQLASLALAIRPHFESLSAGSSVGIIMDSSGEAVAALCAAAAAERPAVLIPPSLKRGEVDQVLATSRPAIVIWGAARDDTTGPGGERAEELAPGVKATRTQEIETLVWPPDVFIVQLTSGSLGPSRLAVRSRQGVDSELRSLTGTLGFRGVRHDEGVHSVDRVLCASSIAHSYGLIGGLLAPLAHAVPIWLAADQEQAVHLAERSGPTVLFGLAATYQGLLAKDMSRALGPRLCFSAGAPLPDGLFDSFYASSGHPIRQDYGTTETGTIALDANDQANPGTVGNPLTHLQVQIAPAAEPHPSNGEGEILIRGKAVAVAYLTRRGFSTATDRGGWYHTGDAGSWTDKHKLRVGRRLRPPIPVGDSLVRPERIEDVIQSLPGVREVAVVGTDTGGRRMLKAVVVAPALETETLRVWCRRHLAVGEQPEIFELRDVLPRSPAGKVLHKYIM